MVHFARVKTGAILAAPPNHVMLRLAVRDARRRKGRTIFILLALMLSSLLFSASLVAGDMLAASIRAGVIEELGEVDIIIEPDSSGSPGVPALFERSRLGAIMITLDNHADVDGIAPILKIQTSAMEPRTGSGEPEMYVIGLPGESVAGFRSLLDESGAILHPSELAPGLAYLSSDLARNLKVGPGDELLAYLDPEGTSLRVAGVYLAVGGLVSRLSLVMPLEHLQSLTGNRDMISHILISGKGGELQCAERTDAVLSALEPALAGMRLKAVPVKRDAIAAADAEGDALSETFMVFGQFSVAAGVLLIFLVFVMLAAERRRELGILRAMGTQRSRLAQMFAVEGLLYAVVSAPLGSLMGVGAGWAMARLSTAGSGPKDVEIAFSFSWQSVFTAALMGAVLTTTIVLISSWWVSRLNIVRAIRNIPEPRRKQQGGNGWILPGLLPLLGVGLAVLGFQQEQKAFWMLGVSLAILGAPLLARRLGLPGRASISLAGLGLVAWWLLPFDALDGVLPEMQQGMELALLSGLMLVAGSVWVIIYNSDLLLGAITRLLGGIRALSPVLRTAVAYPMKHRLRTGLTLAMFSLVMFILTVMAFVTSATAGVYEDTERLSGGFHIWATVNPGNPMVDIGTALRGVEAVGSFTGAVVEVTRRDTPREPASIRLQGVDDGYSSVTSYGFLMTAHGYNSPREVWRALQDEPGTAVVSRELVPSSYGYTVDSAEPFRLQGLTQEDDALPSDVFIDVRHLLTGHQKRLRVIAVLEEMALFAGGDVLTSRDTVLGLLSQSIGPQAFAIRLRDGEDAVAAAQALNASLVEHGMRAKVIADEIRRQGRAAIVTNRLIEGFMGLGLIVGISALGVVAARSVVERRREIGIMRALGFQRRAVQLSFMLESSFVALLGIAVGVGLGFALARNMMDLLSQDNEGIAFIVPWANLVVVSAIAYGTSVLATWLPAARAAKMRPVEALRYE